MAADSQHLGQVVHGIDLVTLRVLRHVGDIRLHLRRTCEPGNKVQAMLARSSARWTHCLLCDTLRLARLRAAEKLTLGVQSLEFALVRQYGDTPRAVFVSCACRGGCDLDGMDVGQRLEGGRERSTCDIVRKWRRGAAMESERECPRNCLGLDRLLAMLVAIHDAG